MCNAHTATNQVFKSQTLKLSVEMMGGAFENIYSKKEALEEGEVGGTEAKSSNDADRDKCKELLSDGSRPFFCPV